MTTFNEREKAHEKKFALDEEQRFKATARRNKLLGLWAAEKLGKIGADADAYAKEVVIADFEEAGDDDVIRKLQKDFAAAGIEIDGVAIGAELNVLMAKAIEQISKS